MSGFLGGGIGPTAIKRRSGLAAPVPVLGAELLTNGGFDSDTAWTKGAGWTIPGDGTAKWATPTASRVTQAVLTVGAWYLAAVDILSATALAPILIRIGNTGGSLGFDGIGTRLRTDRADTTSFGFTAQNEAVAIDNATCKLLSLSSLFSTRAYASADCDLSVGVTRTVGTQAGLVARLDSASSPANFIIAYETGAGSVKVDKCVGGTYTNIIDGAVTYVAGEVLRLVCSGNDVSVYYNGVQVGSTVTVSDASIASNTRHGLFSTYAANTFSGYTAA